MARSVRDHRLETRAARLRLSVRAEPYWRQISEGCHLGYYRGARGGKWVARFRPAGRPGGYDKTTLGETDDYNDSNGEQVLDYKEAQDAARAWFDRQSKGGRKRGPYSVSDCLDDYLRGFTGRSLKKTAARIEVLIRPVLGAIALDQLTAEQVARWHRSRATSPARLRTGRLASATNIRPLDSDEARRKRKVTANRDLTVLKAALNAAYRLGKIHSDEPWRKVRPFPNVEQAKTRYLQADEARRLVNACDSEIRPLVQGALLTGARYGELITLRVRDVDLISETVRWVQTKGGGSRVSYLEAEGLNLFKQHIRGKTGDDFVFTRSDGGPWKASQQGRPMRSACARAQLKPNAGFHDLRRTYGARLAMAGVPMAVIAEALGHADERITRRHYAHLAPSYVAETVRAHVAGLGIVAKSNVVGLPLR